jgi:hypothetical protein
VRQAANKPRRLLGANDLEHADFFQAMNDFVIRESLALAYRPSKPVILANDFS